MRIKSGVHVKCLTQSFMRRSCSVKSDCYFHCVIFTYNVGNIAGRSVDTETKMPVLTRPPCVVLDKLLNCSLS